MMAVFITTAARAFSRAVCANAPLCVAEGEVADSRTRTHMFDTEHRRAHNTTPGVANLGARRHHRGCIIQVPGNFKRRAVDEASAAVREQQGALFTDLPHEVFVVVTYYYLRSETEVPFILVRCQKSTT